MTNDNVLIGFVIGHFFIKHVLTFFEGLGDKP